MFSYDERDSEDKKFKQDENTNANISTNIESIKFSIAGVSSGYRCWIHNAIKGRTSTNHHGKAIDIIFNKNGSRVLENETGIKDLRMIRDLFFSYLNIPKGTKRYQTWAPGLFGLEPIGLDSHIKNKKLKNVHVYTYSWIHIDVREFGTTYLEDRFFCKNSNELNKDKLINLQN